MGFGIVCCFKFGGSCYVDDYFVYGLDRVVKIMDFVFYDDMSLDENVKKLLDYFGLIYGYYLCLLIFGG